MLRTFLLLSTLIIISQAHWRSLIPPRAAGAQEVQAVIPVCQNVTFCKIVVAYTIGDIYSVDMIDFSVVEYHDSQNPIGWATTISGIVYTHAQNQLMVSVPNGDIWSIDIAAQDPTTLWTQFSPSGSTAGSPIMMPLDSVQSTDILMITSNSELIQANPAYSQAVVLDDSMSQAAPTVAIYTDCHQAPYQSQFLMFAGFTDGSVAAYDVASQYAWVIHVDTAQPQTPISKIIIYRNDGDLIIIGFGSMTFYYNFDTGFKSTLPLNNIIDAIIIPDRSLNDWLYSVDKNGLLTRVKISSFPNNDPTQAVVITVQNPDPIHTLNQVIDLQINWVNENPDDMNSAVIPTIITVSQLGTVSVLDTFYEDWKIIANPSEVGGAEVHVTSMMVVSQNSVFTDETSQHILVTTATGEVLFENIPDVVLTRGVPSLAQETNVVIQSDYSKKLPRRLHDGQMHANVTSTTLSFDQLTSLINNNAEVYVTLTTGEVTEQYQIVGYDVNTHPFRLDQQKIIMTLVNNNGFFDDVCCFFEDLWHFYDENKEVIDLVLEGVLAIF